MFRNVPVAVTNKAILPDDRPDVPTRRVGVRVVSISPGGGRETTAVNGHGQGNREWPCGLQFTRARRVAATIGGARETVTCFSRRIYLCYRTFFAEVPKDALKILANRQGHGNALFNRTPDGIGWYFLMRGI
jgi:hypothetical protein